MWNPPMITTSGRANIQSHEVYGKNLLSLTFRGPKKSKSSENEGWNALFFDQIWRFRTRSLKHPIFRKMYLAVIHGSLIYNLKNPLVGHFKARNALIQQIEFLLILAKMLFKSRKRWFCPLYASWGICMGIIWTTDLSRNEKVQIIPKWL